MYLHSRAVSSVSRETQQPAEPHLSGRAASSAEFGEAIPAARAIPAFRAAPRVSSAPQPGCRLTPRTPLHSTPLQSGTGLTAPGSLAPEEIGLEIRPMSDARLGALFHVKQRDAASVPYYGVIAKRGQRQAIRNRLAQKSVGRPRSDTESATISPRRPGRSAHAARSAARISSSETSTIAPNSRAVRCPRNQGQACQAVAPRPGTTSASRPQHLANRRRVSDALHPDWHGSDLTVSSRATASSGVGRSGREGGEHVRDGPS
jgi:hypothetical protein